MEKTIQTGPKKVSNLGYSDVVSSVEEINMILLVHKLIAIAKACRSIIEGMHKDVVYDPSLELHRNGDDDSLAEEFSNVDPDLITYVAIVSQVARRRPPQVLFACKTSLALFKDSLHNLSSNSREAYDKAVDSAVASALEEHLDRLKLRLAAKS